MPMLEIRDLIVLYGEIEALRGVSLSFGNVKAIDGLDLNSYPVNMPLSGRADWRPAQGKPGVLQLEQLIGRQVDGDLVGVLLPAAGGTVRRDLRTGCSRAKELRYARKAYPSRPSSACRHRSITSLASSR